MGYRIKSIILVSCLLVMTIYLIITALEDSKSYEVTRIKHLAGFIPAGMILLVYVRERSLFDIGIIILFVLLCLLIGMKGVYGMADGFVFANLTILFGAIGGVAGIGTVILIMILACFSGMIKMFLRRMVTMENFKKNKQIAFVPHILTGYLVVIIFLGIWM